MTNKFKQLTCLFAWRKKSHGLVGFLLSITLPLSFLAACDRGVGDQMIREMEIAQATAPIENSGTRARVERIEKIKREWAKKPGPIIPSLDYARIAYRQALDEEKKEAVAHVVQKYFSPGMKVEEAFKLLRQLKKEGFYVSETRHDSGREWPDGEFKPYLGVVGRLTHQQHYPKGVSEFLALKKEKKFDPQILFFTKHVVIKFRVVDGSGVISEVKGDVGVTGI